VGLGWQSDVPGLEIDASAFLLSAEGRVPGNGDFIFFNNLEHSSGSVRHLDSQLEGSAGDGAQLRVDLDKVPAHISRIAIALTIYDGENRGQSFSQVQSAYLRLADPQAGTELVRYPLGAGSRPESALVLGELCRLGQGWQLVAGGSGVAGGLQGLVRSFGVGVK